MTPYSIAYKIFNIVFAFSGLLFAPLWSAYTEAFSKGDNLWIKKKLKMTLFAFVLYCGGIVFIILTFDFIKNIWIGSEIVIEEKLIYSMAVFTVLLFWNSIYSTLLNGIGKIKLQVILSVIGAIINIPLSIIFAKYFNMGPSGVIIGSILSLSLGAILLPYQAHLVLSNKAIGIWNQ